MGVAGDAVNETTTCRRCGIEMDGEFCSNCGQYRPKPLALVRLWTEAFGKVLELDIRYVQTIRELSVRPGWMIREYLDGNRTSWVNPGKYVFFNATFYALALTFFVDPAMLELGFEEDMAREMILAIMGMLAYVAFIYLLPAGWVTHLLYREKVRSTAEGYVALLYVYGHAMLILGAVSLSGWWHVAFVRGFLLFYMVFAFTQLTGVPYIWNGFKAVLVYLTYTVAAIVVVGGFMFVRFFAMRALG